MNESLTHLHHMLYISDSISGRGRRFEELGHSVICMCAYGAQILGLSPFQPQYYCLFNSVRLTTELEIRNMIYKLLLEPTEIPCVLPYHSPTVVRYAQILRTCKDIHNEASAMLYASHDAQIEVRVVTNNFRNLTRCEVSADCCIWPEEAFHFRGRAQDNMQTNEEIRIVENLLRRSGTVTIYIYPAQRNRGRKLSNLQLSLAATMLSQRLLDQLSQNRNLRSVLLRVHGLFSGSLNDLKDPRVFKTELSLRIARVLTTLKTVDSSRAISLKFKSRSPMNLDELRKSKKHPSLFDTLEENWEILE